MQVDVPQTKDSWAFRAIVPVNVVTVILVLLKGFGVLDISWLQSLTPGLALAVMLGLMAEYGLYICHQEEKERMQR